MSPDGSPLSPPAAPATSPRVFPLASCSTPAMAGCLVAGYIPEPVSVSWTTGGSSPSVPPRTYPAARGRRGLLTLGSAVGFPAGLREATCAVRHPATGFSRSVRVSAPAPARSHPPHVELLHSCSMSSIHLLCLATGFSPRALSLRWLVDNEPLDPSDVLIEGPTAKGTFMASARLNLTLAEWQEKTFACGVTHRASGTDVEITGHKCISDSIQVFVLPPSPLDLYVSQNPKLRCMVTSLPSDDGLELSWSRSQGGALRPDLLQVKAQFNGTFTATREVLVSTRDWDNGETFTCRVYHRDLPSPISRSISKKPGKRLTPSVYLLPPPPEELSGSHATLSLTCLVRGFYPESISVEWQKNQDSLEDSAYETTPPMKEKAGDASYFLYSRLVVKREDWNKGTTYVCMVVHEGLPMRFIQRSINKSPGKRK
uniref:Ig-like domain-containing protein n=1 Tax=Strigops habroptila TaxID=2489341 RepID=A0A672UPZ4_STRHB